jgi:predicted secreted protein
VHSSCMPVVTVLQTVTRVLFCVAGHEPAGCTAAAAAAAAAAAQWPALAQQVGRLAAVLRGCMLLRLQCWTHCEVWCMQEEGLDALSKLAHSINDAL